MKWFYDLRISKKLISSFVLVSLITLGIGLVGIMNIKTIDANDTKLYQVNTIPIELFGNISTEYQKQRVKVKDVALTKDLNLRKQLIAESNEIWIKMDSYLKDVGKTLPDNQEIKDDYDELIAAFTQYTPNRQKITGQYALGNDANVAALYKTTDVLAQVKVIEALLEEMPKDLVALAKQQSDRNTVIADGATVFMMIVIAVSMILAIALGIIISRIIGNPIKTLSDVANRLALGDVDVEVSANTKDEIGDLMGAFAAMIANTKEQVKVAERIAVGDVSASANVKSDKDILNSKFNEMISAIRNLVDDVNTLSSAGIAGKLSVRAEATKHHGDFRNIVEGMNNTLDAVIEPVKEAAGVLKNMSQGRLDMRVEGVYNGDHAEIKDALNDTLDSLSSYVDEISDVLTKISHSDLQVSIVNDYKGDFAPIKVALNLIISSLNEVLGDISSASDQVASGANQVSDGSQALSQGATEQASSVEELTASITQIAAQTKQNAVNANQANELALLAKEDAQQGNEHMTGMLKSMQEINEASNSISKIIKVIDEIAFQTNILALNAAVEAARAGQHGKGFAVVAEEVRNLAARSANAAKETTAMIEGSVAKVEDGTKIANNTAGALVKIVEGVAKAADLVGDIASASNEQATAIAQVNKGIEQVSQVIQTNSATSEESAAASEELSSQAALLKDMLSKFKLKRRNSSGVSDYLMAGGYETPSLDVPRHQDDYLAKIQKTSKNEKVRIALSDAEFGKY